MKTNYWIIACISIFIHLSCFKPKTVDINLPLSQTQPTVECYIEAEKPLRLALSETLDSYTSGIPVDTKDAFVTITHSGIIDTLQYLLQVDNSSGFRKVYNYYNSRIIHFQQGEQFYLYIKTPKGQTLTSQSTFINVVPIDSIYTIENSDTEIALNTTFYDNLSTKDYYRVVIVERDTTHLSRKDSANIIRSKKTLFTDELIKTSKVSINTGDNYGKTDTLEVYLYHLDKPYYDFARSVSDAELANGDPFAIPSQIKSNITGGIGIFQCLSYDHKKAKMVK